MEGDCGFRAGTGTSAVPVARFVRCVGAGLVVAGLALVGVAACARTSVENVKVHAAGLAKPELIIVHEFSVSPDEVTLDTGIGARLREKLKGTPEAEEQLSVGQEAARIVAENLVKEIRKLGIPAVGLSAASPVSGPTLSIQGQFLTVDQGNRTRRMIVGFGAGASEVRTLVQVYAVTNEGRRLVEDFYTTVKSSRKPGLGPMAGVGAAAGRAASSAAVAGGVGVATERSQTVESDATRTAQEIAKVLAKFFAEQGWIPPQR